jgi:hypothetical protein
MTSIELDASLSSDLKWEVASEAPHILWELNFQIEQINLAHLSSHQLAVKCFVESIWEKHQETTLGVVLYRGKVPVPALEEFAEYLHHLAAYLPDEVPPFALFDCVGDPLKFSKEIFPHIHLGFRSGLIGAIKWDETLIPLRYDGSLGVVLPLRERGLQFDVLDECLANLDRPCRLIAEPYITEEWDELDTLLIFPDHISTWGMRMVQGFEAAGGKVIRYKESG